MLSDEQGREGTSKNSDASAQGPRSRKVKCFWYDTPSKTRMETTGYPVAVPHMPSLQFIAHQRLPYCSLWLVTEQSSGSHCGSLHRTRKAAIEVALRRLNEETEEGMRKRIACSIAKQVVKVTP